MNLSVQEVSALRSGRGLTVSCTYLLDVPVEYLVEVQLYLEAHV